MTNSFEGIEAEAAGLGSRLGDWMGRLREQGAEFLPDKEQLRQDADRLLSGLSERLEDCRLSLPKTFRDPTRRTLGGGRLLLGLLIGAGAMFLFDPKQGAARRRRIVEKVHGWFSEDSASGPSVRVRAPLRRDRGRRRLSEQTSGALGSATRGRNVLRIPRARRRQSPDRSRAAGPWQGHFSTSQRRRGPAGPPRRESGLGGGDHLALCHSLVEVHARVETRERKPLSLSPRTWPSWKEVSVSVDEGCCLTPRSKKSLQGVRSPCWLVAKRWL